MVAVVQHICYGRLPSCSFHVLWWLANNEVTHYRHPLLWSVSLMSFFVFYGGTFVYTLFLGDTDMTVLSTGTSRKWLYLTTKVGFSGQNKIKGGFGTLFLLLRIYFLYI